MSAKPAKARSPSADPRAIPWAPAFRARLLEWFRCGGRDYPWRQTEDPYAILVSEMMLQQTQIATVLDKSPAAINSLLQRARATLLTRGAAYFLFLEAE